MKTKKVLALIVSAVMILSLMPAMAFGGGVTAGTNLNINTYGSVVEGPDGSVSAQSIGDINGNNDGAEFNLTIISSTAFAAGDTIYVASRRFSVDYFYYKDAAGDWVPFGGTPGVLANMQQTSNLHAMEITFGDMLRLVGGSTTVATATIKVVSTATGTSQIVFGRDADDTATYARGTTPTNGLSNIIGTRTFPAEFSAPKANGLLLSAVRTGGGTGSVYANNVDTYTVTAYITTLRDGGGLPVSGAQVNFSVLSGTGATLTATSVTTNVSGRAETKVYSSRADSITVTATVSGINPYTVGEFYTYASGDYNTTNYRDRVVLPFGSTGIVSIRPESGDNQKVARDAGGIKWFRFSAYDANNTRLDFNRIIPAARKVAEYTPLGTNRWDVTDWMKNSTDTGPEMQATIVTSPSGAAIRAGDII
ncbi:MAG: Ig-like domain-containing protein, partial [Oscillospiraceae bacterium]|nr:Ig-like domain-containing protein [Oscillospiraceae bacterium]